MEEGMEEGRGGRERERLIKDCFDITLNLMTDILATVS